MLSQRFYRCTIVLFIDICILKNGVGKIELQLSYSVVNLDPGYDLVLLFF